MQITRSVMGAVGFFTALCGAVGLAASFDRCKVLARGDTVILHCR